MEREKEKFIQARNFCKRFLETFKLAYVNKIKESITLEKLGTLLELRLANLLILFSRKGNLIDLPHLEGFRCCLLRLKRQRFLLKSFLKFIILMIKVFLPAFPSWTKLKLHNNTLTLKLVVINFDYSGISDFFSRVPVVVVKDCGPKLSYVLGEYFNLCLNDSWFPDFCKVSSVVAIFKNNWET